MGRTPREPWNINIHYDRLLVSMARPGTRVLDVGCGDGFLSARLAERGCDVVAVDADADVLERAKARWPEHDVEWLHGDLLTSPLEPGSFDVVLSNATLHHLPDARAALTRLGELVATGGQLGIVGFARDGIADWPMSLIGSIGVFVLVRARGKWEHTAPVVWPPELSYGELRRVTAEVLPGRAFRRLWLGRWLLTWTKPTAA